MSAVETMPLLTAAEAAAGVSAERWELVRGVVRELMPPGGEHGTITYELAFALGLHVKRHQLGRLFAAETGFLITRNPDTVQGADVAFIQTSRIPVPIPSGWMQTVPDLVVEVVSPNDRVAEVEEKIEDWLMAGVRLLWVVWPRLRQVQVYRSRSEVQVLTEGDTLEGADVIPGFSLPLAEIFA